MSPTDLIVIAKKKDIVVTVQPPSSIPIRTPANPSIIVIAAGNVGPPGPSGKWEALTQNEYDLLTPPDPDTLYIIIQ